MKTDRTVARTARYCVLLSLLVSTAGWSVPASATEGDVFAEGIEYRPTTYGSEKYPHPSKCGTPLDIVLRKGTQLYAPENGKIEKQPESWYRKGKNKGGWGYNIYWIGDSGEKLFLAHLEERVTNKTVKAGDPIGKIGDSGGPWGPNGSYGQVPHLHIERCGDEQLELSGRKIGAGNTYTSKGPVKLFFHIEESDGSHSVKIEWYPADKSCVDAYMRMYNNTCDARPAEEICKEAQEGLSGFSWKYLLGDWEKIFLGHEEIKKYVERVGSCSIDKHVDKPDTTCFQF